MEIKQKAFVDVLNEVTKLKAIGNHYKLFSKIFIHLTCRLQYFVWMGTLAHPVFTLRALFYQDLFLNFMIVL